ncbi:MAG TPA: PD-(D/E)XK nuclease family protein, partial [Chloroflexota bacterium]|nr:PD-(D/E)XK nuclease family protein [Chloroflexota bacterium]
ARAYDLAPAAFRASSLPAHVRLLLEAGEGLPLPPGAAEVSGPGVRVLTVHAAKGLEFPVVFVPNLAKDRFPGRGRAGQTLAPGILATDEAAARVADDRCLFFVALSRARDRLILSYAERYGGRAAAPSPLLALAEPSFAIEAPLYARWPTVAGTETGPSQRHKPTFGGPAHEPVEVSFQGIETYLQCPRRFYYADRLDLRGAAEAQGFPHFQRALRRALARLRGAPAPEQARRARPTNDHAASEQALDILEEEWAAEHDAHPYEALYLERARRIVSTAHQALRDRSPAVASAHDAEYQVTRPGGVIQVRIDRVDQPADGVPVAVRYRSGRASGDHRRDHRAALYSAALHGAHGAGSVQQEYLSLGTADQAQARASTLEARLRECDEALAGIAGGEFPARPGDHCPSCPFWLICPAG